MLTGLGQYAGASSVTLFDGTVISDPANTPATQEQCIPFWCGANPQNSDVRYWCGFWGRSGNIPCIADECAPYRSASPSCNLIAPTIEVPNPPPAPAPIAAITPASIVQPLPDMTIPNTPVPVPAQSSCFCSLNQWINDNPVLAVAALAGVFLLAKGGSR